MRILTDLYIQEGWGFAPDLVEPLPLLRPLREYSDATEFDREVCRAGVKRFVRRGTPADHPWGLVEVLELSPGLRVRRGRDR